MPFPRTFSREPGAGGCGVPDAGELEGGPVYFTVLGASAVDGIQSAPRLC